MCAIVDANVRDEVFGDNPTGAGKFFREWLAKPNGGILVVGGTKLRKELGSAKFIIFLQERINAGRARRIPDGIVDDEESELRAQDICRSDDEHILALARKSGARLLFTNDNDLIRDFKNSKIITSGVIYTTRNRKGTTGNPKDTRPTHRKTLSHKHSCDWCR